MRPLKTAGMLVPVHVWSGQREGDGFKDLGWFGASGFIAFDLPPGRLALSTLGFENAALETELKSDNTYFFKVEFQMKYLMVYDGIHLSLLPEDEGSKTLAGLKPPVMALDEAGWRIAEDSVAAMKWKQIRIGMSTEEVEALLGADAKRLGFRLSGLASGGRIVSYGDEFYTIHFMARRVVAKTHGHIIEKF